MKTTPIPILSFFSGGGFLDMGFEQAGFEIIWTNDNNPRFVELYKYGYSKWRFTERRKKQLPYVESRSIEDLTPGMVTYRSFPHGRPQVFGIIGGPPCPDFSTAGAHNGKKGANGKHVKYYVDLVCELRPTFFLLENVTGLVRFKKHRSYFEQLVDHLHHHGYQTDYRILNALEFGVPQHRGRLFLVGVNKKFLNKRSNSEDWFRWPSIKAYENADSRFNWPSRTSFGSRPRRPRNLPPELCVGSYLVPSSKRHQVPNANCVFQAYSKKFYKVDEGDTSQKSFKRLHRYRYSPTACYGNNEVHLHPWEPRRLSLREAMRIQGIPDSYVLPETVALQTAFKMVSNGVPVPLSKAVARSIKSMLRRNAT